MSDPTKAFAKTAFESLPRKKLRFGTLPAVDPKVYVEAIPEELLPEKTRLAETLYKGYNRALAAGTVTIKPEEKSELEVMTRYWRDASGLLIQRESLRGKKQIQNPSIEILNVSLEKPRSRRPERG